MSASNARHFTIPAPSTAEPGPTVTRRVFERDRYACVYCNARGVTVQVDHVRARAHFPVTAPTATVNALNNLVTACAECNGAKGPQNLHGFAAMLRGRGISAKVIAAMVRRVSATLRRSLPLPFPSES